MAKPRAELEKLKAQASVEYLFIIAILMLFLVPAAHYSTDKAVTDFSLDEAQVSLNELARAADMVYAMGPGTKAYAWLTIPNSATSTNVSGKEIVVTTAFGGANSDLFAMTKANLTGSIPGTPGTYKISAEALETGTVNISRVS